MERDQTSVPQAEPQAGPGRIAHSLIRGPVEIETRGDAMAPLVRPGDRVRLERRTPKRGEVALISIAGRLVLHRLVRKRGQAWLVHVDRPGAHDAWVHSRQVVAIATERLRAGQAGWVRLGRDQGIGHAIRAALFGAK